MKSLKILLVAVLTLCATFVSAQEKRYDNLVRLYVSPALQQWPRSEEPANMGAQIGFGHLYYLGGTTSPVFLQWGGEFNYLTHTETVVGEKVKVKFTNVALPLQIVHRFGADHPTGLELSYGVNFRFNLSGEESTSMATLSYMEHGGNRFQFGLNVGLAYRLSAFTIGYRYNPDLTPYVDKEKARQDHWQMDDSNTFYHFLTLGYSF